MSGAGLTAVETLMRFAVNRGLMDAWDIPQARNALFSLLKYRPEDIDENLFNRPDRRELHETATDILAGISDDYAARGHFSAGGTAERDRLEAAVMGLLMPRQSEAFTMFLLKYENSPESATEYFYNLCRAANYIQVERLKKDLRWTAPTEYGGLEITVNLSKPEKDPYEIAAAGAKPAATYPRCLLCPENIGFAGTQDWPPRQNLRAMPVSLDGDLWYFQYSPYAYYNEHCIVLNERHVPMAITERTFRQLIEFVNDFPHYFVGSNADLPIVGGSILSHDHFQGGRHVFPMERAGAYKRFAFPAYGEIDVSLVKWPLSAIRLNALNAAAGQQPGERAETERQMAALAARILNAWRVYDLPEAGILSRTGETPHNTVTPIARYNSEGKLQLDIVLRNNCTTAEHPMGLFHPHAERHHIKKENIGLIEVMGLAVLPGRLLAELDAGALTREEINRVFLNVLRDCGVFKDDAEGREQFVNFIGGVLN